jgi:hypothetical protein
MEPKEVAGAGIDAAVREMGTGQSAARRDR